MLARLANLPRIVGVDNLNLAATTQQSRKEKGKKEKQADDDDDRSDHTLLASFTATAYSLRDPASVEQAPPAEKDKGRTIRTASGKSAPSTQAGVGSPSRTTPGALTKRLSDKAKSQPSEGGAH
jgi:hypothetical protein